MKINFKHEINGEKLITAIAQDFKSNQILMVGNMNKEALIKTLKTGKAHYWSRYFSSCSLNFIGVPASLSKSSVYMKMKPRGGSPSRRGPGPSAPSCLSHEKRKLRLPFCFYR